ncbi:MAG: TonB-dependent receptor plug domain-containing protein, partial [Epsilonproteobacteria bacterium]|nr:TonB-dependent receptor plug domain-containing protein [Campylobacterota bacterium]
MKHFIFILPFISFLLYAEENLSELLEIYQKKSDLSNITKKESAGFLDLYTRDDLEKMQAHNLIDVLKTLSSLYITRGQNNTYHFYKPSSSKMPLPSIRLYINDHDMSSTTFGSAFLIWGEMPISYIDHIEVYKSVSSIEFGNETATLLIRLYTKDASRENGGKFQTLIDNYGSYDTSFYYAQTFENDFSYFAYIQKDNINREVYHNYYNNKEYDFNSDKKGYNFYANLSYKNWRVELGNYKKRNDSFIGIGIHKTPDGGELKARQSYIHVTKKFDNGIKLQIAFDDMVYRRTYFDENDIAIYNGYMDSINYVQDYYIKFHDQIFSTIIEKIYKTENNKILLGG